MKIEKKCVHHGPVRVIKQKHSFIFLPSVFRSKFAVFYSVSGEENEDDKLLVSTEVYKKGENGVIITLQREDSVLRIKDVFKMSLDTDYVDLKSEKDEEVIDKTLQVSGDYCLSSDGGVAEVVFNYINGTTYWLFVNPSENIYVTHKWLCDNWKPRSKHVEFCICVNNDMVDHLRVFQDYYNDGIIRFNVTEICKIIPWTRDDLVKSLPWSNKGEVMIESLSKVLEVDPYTILLRDIEGRDLSHQVSLNKEHYRSKEDEDYPTLYYEIRDAKVTCHSLKEGGDSMDVMVFKERTVGEMKRRLALKMNINEKRLIVCSKKVILPNKDIVFDHEEVSYCVGLSEDDINKIREIGRGSFGSVWKCETSSGKLFALKTFLHSSNDSDIKTDLIREFLFMFTSKHHDNVIDYFDIYVNGNNISLSMELVSGGTLTNYIRKIKNGLEEHDIRRISRDILNGLKHLHDKPIIHCGIKSDNVLIGEGEISKLSDFGISRIFTEDMKTQLSSGVVLSATCGTYRYLAPEIINKVLYGKKSDIWAVGAVVVEMITGKKPHHEIEEEMAVIFKVSETKSIDYTPPYPLSTELKEFVDSCLKSNHKERGNVAALLSLSFFKNSV